MTTTIEKPETTPAEAARSAEIASQVKAARRVGTPIIGVVTPDPAATIYAVCDAINGDCPKIAWDIVRGFQELRANDETKQAMALLTGESGDRCEGNPPDAIRRAMDKLPDRSVLFVHLANRWFESPMFVQAVWLLRDLFKQDRRTLIMLGPSMPLPAELAGDVVVFDEPLPGADELQQIIERIHADAELQIPAAELLTRSVEAVQGLPAFQAEQVVAMSLRRSGLDIDALWERKRKQIELTPGLKVHRGGETFQDIGGVANIKGFMGRILHGQARPNAVVFVDEIEKMLGPGSGAGDTSGVSQDQLGSLLTYMQDQGAVGSIFVGPPGSAKSMIAKAAGNEAGIPTIQLDMGGLKGSLVGQSEQQLRAALKVITSVSNGRSLWIATCNAIGDLPPELRRRFTLGTFFFELPDKAEREAIWAIHLKRYALPAKNFRGKLPADEGWTGAEIRQCCDIAWRLGVSLKDAAQYVVPVARSAAEQIQKLRRTASGRFLSASHAGIYTYDETTAPTASGSRRLELED